jgi:putative methionine-R-sulfoxide reductase with GAF domain
VPVFVGDRVWGVINVESRDEDAYDAEDVRAVESVAALLGSSLRRGAAS